MVVVVPWAGNLVASACQKGAASLGCKREHHRRPYLREVASFHREEAFVGQGVGDRHLGPHRLREADPKLQSQLGLAEERTEARDHQGHRDPREEGCPF